VHQVPFLSTLRVLQPPQLNRWTASSLDKVNIMYWKSNFLAAILLLFNINSNAAIECPAHRSVAKELQQARSFLARRLLKNIDLLRQAKRPDQKHWSSNLKSTDGGKAVILKKCICIPSLESFLTAIL
jgi:hypothetical protein